MNCAIWKSSNCGLLLKVFRVKTDVYVKIVVVVVVVYFIYSNLTSIQVKSGALELNKEKNNKALAHQEQDISLFVG